MGPTEVVDRMSASWLFSAGPTAEAGNAHGALFCRSGRSVHTGIVLTSRAVDRADLPGF
jgi:hypothetical protein